MKNQKNSKIGMFFLGAMLLATLSGCTTESPDAKLEKSTKDLKKTLNQNLGGTSTNKNFQDALDATQKAQKQEMEKQKAMLKDLSKPTDNINILY